VKHFTAGDHVRLVFPGSKLHGTTGRLKHPTMPGGWWLVEADKPLDDPPPGGEPERHFRAPESWLQPCDVEARAEAGAEASLGRIAALRGRRRE